MGVRSIVARTTATFVALILFASSAVLAWAAAHDYVERSIVLPGVSLYDGTDLSGMSPTEVARTTMSAFAHRDRPLLTVHADGLSSSLDPAHFLEVDVEGVVRDALAPGREMPLAKRALHRATNTPVGREVTPRATVARAALTRAIEGVAAAVYRPPVDASIHIEKGAVVVRPSAPGRSVDVTAAVDSVSRALLEGAPFTEIAVDFTPAAIVDADLGRTIVVSLSTRRLTLYNGTEVERTYRVAVGRPGYSTPRGTWRITLKRHMPTWGNPGSAWAAEMPRYIPPGPNNPLGTRALNLNAPWIRIHGTSDESSIGRAASRGCIRLNRRDIEELYRLVDVGTPVLIVR